MTDEQFNNLTAGDLIGFERPHVHAIDYRFDVFLSIDKDHLGWGGAPMMYVLTFFESRSPLKARVCADPSAYKLLCPPTT